MELVGYCTSHKEIKDIYQSIYLLQRAPGLPSCRHRLRRKAIQDILSSLKGRLHRHGHSTTARDLELQEKEQFRWNLWGSYKEALRAAHQRVLDTAEALKSDIERLSWRRNRLWTHSRTHFLTHSWSRSHSRTRSHSRSHSRACSQNCSQGSTQNVCTRSPDGPPPGRRVNFRNPNAEMSPKRDVEDYSMGPSVLDVEMGLEWKAWHLGTPPWWTELKAFPGIRDPWKLTQKIRASFYIPKVRMRALLEPEYTVPPTQSSLNRNAFFQMSYPIKMYGNNRLYWQLLTPGACNTRWKNKVCWEASISII